MHYESLFDSASGTWMKESAGPSCRRPDFKFESSGDSSESDRDSDRYFSFQSHHEDTEPYDVSVYSPHVPASKLVWTVLCVVVLQEPSLEASSGDVEVWKFESDSPELWDPAPQTNESSQLNGSPVLKLVGFICTFLVSWQAVFRIPDGALNTLFKFLSLFLQKLLTLTGAEQLRMLHQYFPSSLLLAQKMRCEKQTSFCKFVVCQKCFTTYNIKDCLGKDGIRKCTYVRFPTHPQKRMRMSCNGPLLKLAKCPSGRFTFYPHKVFCFRSGRIDQFRME